MRGAQRARYIERIKSARSGSRAVADRRSQRSRPQCISQERGAAVARTLGDKGALILRNHGIVTAGSTIEHAVFLAIKLEKACRIQMLAEQAGGPKLFVKEEELVAKRGRTNRNDSQGNAFSYLVRRWHLRCNCEVPKEYQATLDNFDRTGYKSG